MKVLTFILFFTVFFGIYFSANYYVFVRGLQSLPVLINKYLFIILFWFLALSFIIARFTEAFQIPFVSKTLIWTGSLWMAMLIYLFLMVLAVDIVRLFNLFFHYLPVKGSNDYINLKNTAFYIVSLSAIIIVVIGYINAAIPIVNIVEIQTSKKLPQKQLTIAVASDIHLGELVGKSKLDKLVKILNENNPDIIILAGDILDEIQKPIFQKNIGKPLQNLKAPLGVYAVNGNHEYIGGVKEADKYITSLGIKLLVDSVVKPCENVAIIGRDDKEVLRYTGKNRKPLKDLLTGIVPGDFTILADHQPYHLKETVENNIDLQVSGHTHHGQMWPLNFLVGVIFEISHGYEKRGNTHFYVSNGYGTWGPPVRIGNRPEVVIIKVQGE